MTSSYIVAERFKSIQGEGLYAGTPMAFIRFVGCSVGKKVCNGCDTDFETTPWHLGMEWAVKLEKDDFVVNTRNGKKVNKPEALPNFATDRLSRYLDDCGSTWRV